MARRVPTEYRSMRPETKHLMKFTSNTALRKLHKAGIQPKTMPQQLKQIVKREAQRINVPIVVSPKHFKGKFRNDDGLATRPKGSPKILLHPIVKYYSPKYIKTLIGHEHDHIKVMKKRNQITRF